MITEKPDDDPKAPPKAEAIDDEAIDLEEPAEPGDADAQPI